MHSHISQPHPCNDPPIDHVTAGARVIVTVKVMVAVRVKIDHGTAGARVIVMVKVMVTVRVKIDHGTAGAELSFTTVWYTREPSSPPSWYIYTTLPE